MPLLWNEFSLRTLLVFCVRKFFGRTCPDVLHSVCLIYDKKKPLRFQSQTKKMRLTARVKKNSSLTNRR